MEPLSYTQSILDWHIIGHMTIPKKHASELDIPEMYVAPKPKDGKNAILANWKCLVKYDISMRENLWIYVCFVCYTKVWVCAMSKAWGGKPVWPGAHSMTFLLHMGAGEATTVLILVLLLSTFPTLKSALKFRGWTRWPEILSNSNILWWQSRWHHVF